MSLLREVLKRFAAERRGGVAVVTGLALPVLAVLAAGAIDMVSLRADRAKIQDTLDEAAIQAAQQMSVTDPAALSERTRAYVEMQLAALRSRARFRVLTRVSPDGKSVKVSLEGRRTSFFVNLLPPGGWPLHNSSTAVPMGQVPLCVLSMGLDNANKIEMKDQSRITANGCLVHSDGDIRVTSTALLQASMVQSSGLASGRISPQAQTGAPEIPDPFADMKIRPDAVCTPVDVIYNLGLVPLPPGVHCGNIKVDESATLSLLPGEHYFLSGKLELAKTAKLVGSNVVLIFDKNSDFKFGDASQVSLRGRETGRYAGFVIATSRKNDHVFEISSTAARELLGTIYIPNATLKVSGLSGSVNDQAAWTVIVAKSIQMTGGSNLVVNSDYAASDVPAPEGVGPTLKGARLVH
jgi:hypothetical protein